MKTKTPLAPKKRRRGRPIEHGTSNLLAIIYLLSKADALANSAEIAQLLNISEIDALALLDQLSTSYANDTGPLLPLCNTENTNEFMRIDSAGSTKAKVLRLSARQARACEQALNSAGILPQNPLRQKLARALFPHDFPCEATTVSDAEADEACETLIVCAKSLVGAKRSHSDVPKAKAQMVTFKYHGSNDTITRTRRVVPLLIHLHEESWNIEAFDLDTRSTRTFRVALIQNPKLTGEFYEVPISTQERPEGGKVELVCNEYAASRVLSWDGAHVLSQDKESTLIEVPYFRGDWLPRHVLSLGKNVSFKNARLSAEIRSIAAENLKLANKLKGQGLC